MIIICGFVTASDAFHIQVVIVIINRPSCPSFSFLCFGNTNVIICHACAEIENNKTTGRVNVESEILSDGSVDRPQSGMEVLNTHTLINSTVHVHTQYIHRLRASPSLPEISQAFVSPCESLNLRAVSKIGAS